MNFNDLNEVMKLTYKADFIKTINQDPNSIKGCFFELRDQGLMTFEEAFDMVVKYIETRKMTITDKVIEDLFNGCYEVYEVFSAHLPTYIELSKCYIHEDREASIIGELLNDNFIEEADSYFSMMISSYYLKVLVERSEDIEEISRINELLKKQVSIFKSRTGRE